MRIHLNDNRKTDYSDLSPYFRFFFIICLTFIHIRGFYTNQLIETIFSIPIISEVCLNRSANYFFFTLSGYYIEKKYGNKAILERDFLSSHYLKLFKMGLITFPISIIFQQQYYHDGVNILNSMLDITLLRTGFIQGDINPYNQPLWFINVLFILYLVYFIEHQFVKKNRFLVHFVILIFFLGMCTGVYSISLADSRLRLALMAFFAGMIMSNIDDTMKKSGKTRIITVVLCVLVILIFWGEILFYGGIKNTYPIEFKEVSIELLLWMPLTWICSHVTIHNTIANRASKRVNAVATSLFIWQWPLLVYIGKMISKIGLYTSSFKYTCVQFLVLIAFSYISSVWIEPIFSKAVDYCLNLCRDDNAEM